MIFRAHRDNNKHPQTDGQMTQTMAEEKNC